MPTVPRLSVVVVIYDMREEALNTLYSLAPAYQAGISAEDYEIIVVDNASPQPLEPGDYSELGADIRYFYYTGGSASPAAAINFAVGKSRADLLCIMIDGARIVTPGLLALALRGFAAFPNPVLTSLAFHIGPAVHRRAVEELGHTKAKERELLRSIKWRTRPYRLFEVSTLGGSSAEGWFRPPSESSTLFVRKETFLEAGGCDERFDEPGGGYLGLALYQGLYARDGVDLVMLLGEGSFHQMHNGAMTGTDSEDRESKRRRWRQQFIDLVGRAPRQAPRKAMNFLGTIPPESLHVLHHSVEKLREAQARKRPRP